MKYVVLRDMNIRASEPKVVDYYDRKARKRITNDAGDLHAGDTVEVSETITNERFETWGRYSGVTGAGKALWVIIRDSNRIFMIPSVEGDAPGAPVDTLSRLMARLEKLEAWAKTQGYEG